MIYICFHGWSSPPAKPLSTPLSPIHLASPAVSPRVRGKTGVAAHSIARAWRGISEGHSSPLRHTVTGICWKWSCLWKPSWMNMCSVPEPRPFPNCLCSWTRVPFLVSYGTCKRTGTRMDLPGKKQYSEIPRATALPSVGTSPARWPSQL